MIEIKNELFYDLKKVLHIGYTKELWDKLNIELNNRIYFELIFRIPNELREALNNDLKKI
jgi:hypothetical protein